MTDTAKQEGVRPKFRTCALGIWEPSRVLFGQRYGVCPLKAECPDNIVCGYAYTQEIIRTLPHQPFKEKDR